MPKDDKPSGGDDDGDRVHNDGHGDAETTPNNVITGTRKRDKPRGSGGFGRQTKQARKYAY